MSADDRWSLDGLLVHLRGESRQAIKTPKLTKTVPATAPPRKIPLPDGRRRRQINLLGGDEHVLNDPLSIRIAGEESVENGDGDKPEDP